VSAEQPVRLVAARRGTAGVCAWQQPERPGATLLEVIRADGLAAAVVRRLPTHPAGTSPGVSRALASDAGPDSPGLLATVPAARTTAERSTAAVAAILHRPHLRAGQIVAQLRDPAGRVCRSRILRWCDNPDGRYQVTVDRPSGGPQRLTVVSSDARRLGEAVQRLLDSLSTR
jgi:hypothetical protein